MKIRLMLVVALLTYSAQSIYAQTARELWEETFVSKIQNSAYISYILTYDGVAYGEPFNLDTVCCVTTSANEMWQTCGFNEFERFDNQENLWITTDTFCFFNRKEDNIVYGTTWKDSSQTTHSWEFNNLILPLVGRNWISVYIPLYFLQWEYSPEKRVPEDYRDSMWNGSLYWVFRVVDHSRGSFDGDTVIPNDDTLYYFVNKKSHLVDRLDVYSHNKTWEQYGCEYERIIFHDVKVHDAKPPLGDEWNINSPIYTNTPRYSIYQHVPPSIAIMHPYDTYRVIDQQILDYPLQDIHGDTVSIGQMKGWLLIDFFQFGCRPCVEFHKSMQDESQANGLCRLEESGVKVVCIHPYTGISDALKRYVERFGLQTRAYCARDLSPLIKDLNHYPKYYLISPDKTIVLEDEDDAEKILKAIKEYEKSR